MFFTLHEVSNSFILIPELIVNYLYCECVEISIKRIVMKQDSNFILDFSQLPYIDSYIIGSTIKIREIIQTHNANFYITGLTELSKTIFYTAGLNSHFKVLTNEEFSKKLA